MFSSDEETPPASLCTATKTELSEEFSPTSLPNQQIPEEKIAEKKANFLRRACSIPTEYSGNPESVIPASQSSPKDTEKAGNDVKSEPVEKSQVSKMLNFRLSSRLRDSRKKYFRFRSPGDLQFSNSCEAFFFLSHRFAILSFNIHLFSAKRKLLDNDSRFFSSSLIKSKIS